MNSPYGDEDETLKALFVLDRSFERSLFTEDSLWETMSKNLRGRGFPFGKEKIFQEAYPFLKEDSIAALVSEDSSPIGLQQLLEELKGAISTQHKEGLPYTEDKECFYSFLVGVYDNLFEGEIETGEGKESCSCLVPPLQSLLALYPLYRKTVGVDNPKTSKKLGEYLNAMCSIEFYQALASDDFTEELEGKYRALMESALSEVRKIKQSILYSDNRKKELLLEGVLPGLVKDFYFPLLEELLSYCEGSSKRVRLLSIQEAPKFFAVFEPLIISPSLMDLFDFARLISETMKDYEAGDLEDLAPSYILDVDRARFETIMSTSLSDYLLNVKVKAGP